jgi:hypothetical protein
MNVDKPNQITQNPAFFSVLQQLKLLNSPADERFDRLTRLAAKVMKTPISFISIIDEDRQVFKSQVGLPQSLASQQEIPLSKSFWKHMAAEIAPLAVEDARLDPILKNNPIIPGYSFIAYLGVPLTTKSGVTLGSFSVIDHQPRKWGEEEIYVMQELAFTAMTEIELRSEKAMRSQVEADLEAMVKVHTQKYEHVINNMMEIDRLRSLFFDRISMELHVPITNLNLYLKLLEDGRPEKKEHYMMVLKQQSAKLFQLVQAIVAHSQMEPEDIAEQYIFMNLKTTKQNCDAPI